MTDGCSHYENQCEIWAPCCHQYYRCFRCHDENDSSCGKPLDRSNVTKIRCVACEMDQEPVRECEGCHIPFAEYVCLECSMYRQSHPDGIFHCPDCKVCRIGKGLGISHWHCHSCCLCLCIRTVKKKDHEMVCKIDSRTLECVICFEPLHDSRDPLVVGHSCGHYLHQSCWEAYSNTTGKIACPICQRPYLEIDEWKAKFAAIFHHVVFWAIPLVAMVMIGRDKLKAILAAASLAIIIAGLQRDDLRFCQIALHVAIIFVVAAQLAHQHQHRLEDMVLLHSLPYALDQVLPRLLPFHLEGRMRGILFWCNIIASAFVFGFLLDRQYDVPAAPVHPDVAWI